MNFPHFLTENCKEKIKNISIPQLLNLNAENLVHPATLKALNSQLAHVKIRIRKHSRSVCEVAVILITL